MFQYVCTCYTVSQDRYKFIGLWEDAKCWVTSSIIPGVETKDVVDSKMLVDMMSVHILGRSVDICFCLLQRIKRTSKEREVDKGS